jgi:hypothetical protein
MEKPLALVLQEPTFVVAAVEKIRLAWSGISAMQKEKSYIEDRIRALLTSE